MTRYHLRQVIHPTMTRYRLRQVIHPTMTRCRLRQVIHTDRWYDQRSRSSASERYCRVGLSRAGSISASTSATTDNTPANT